MALIVITDSKKENTACIKVLQQLVFKNGKADKLQLRQGNSYDM